MAPDHNRQGGSPGRPARKSDSSTKDTKGTKSKINFKFQISEIELNCFVILRVLRGQYLLSAIFGRVESLRADR